MKQPGFHLKWWQLKLIVPSLFALLVLEKKYLTLSPMGHQLMSIAIVLVVYGLIASWLYSNHTSVGQPASLPEQVAQNETSDLDHPA